MDPSPPRVQLELWRADAIVRFDWLMTVDLDDVPIAHPAENRRWLTCLLASNMRPTFPVSPRPRLTPPGRKLPGTWAGDAEDQVRDADRGR
jgi:hypothetical protein